MQPMRSNFSIKISRKKGFIRLFAFYLLGISFAVNAQNNTTAAKVAGGLFAGKMLVDKFSKKTDGKVQKSQGRDTAAVLEFNARPAENFSVADIQDISGVWEGQQSNGNLIMYYQLCLNKINATTYSGFNYCEWQKNIDHTPVTNAQGQIPNGKKSFIGTFNNGQFSFKEIQGIENNKWGLSAENLKFINDNGTAAIINNDKNQPNRKFYLKRTNPVFPADYLKFVLNDKSLEIKDPLFKNSHNAAVLRFNDRGQLLLSLKNNADIGFNNIKGQVTTLEQDNGFINPDKLYSIFNIQKNSEISLPLSLNTDFSVPPGKIHFNIVFSMDGIILSQKTIEVATESFYKTSNTTSPEYTSARMKAVASYYGFTNAPYGDAPKLLDPLATQSDKMASAWKAVFLTMGYGGYKIDEALGYNLAKTDLTFIEEKTRNGDAEAAYLMFYACQMGLEGETARTYGKNFLQKSALKGFMPAVYDYALAMAEQKNYTEALDYLKKAYASGIKKSANIIGKMYEQGYGTNKDIAVAVDWFKKGIAFGDPDAALSFAAVCANGYEDTPPDMAKAMSLAQTAAAKNCTKAMVFLGLEYFNGKHGIARNMPAALKWFKAGSELGDRQAMFSLGIAYMGDLPGMAKDEKTGLFWIKKAAELGSPIAMRVLSKYYNEGTVTEKNIIAARYWYNQAAVNGFATPDQTGINAEADNFLNFWKYADFSPSYVYVDEYGHYLRDGDDGFFNGICTGILGAAFSYYSNQQQLIDGLEYICKRNGFKIYGGTVSSHFISNLYLKQNETVAINSYGVVSTGMISGLANADGLGNSWQEYTIIKGIPCSSVIAGLKDANDWKFIGTAGTYTAAKDGPLVLALNAIDYRNYRGYFDVVIKVPEN